VPYFCLSGFFRTHCRSKIKHHLINILHKNQDIFHPVVPFERGRDKLFSLDLTTSNKDLNATLVNDTLQFSNYIDDRLKTAKARYAIGGYAEHRTVYSRSVVFDGKKGDGEPRRLHLGTDIWGAAGTLVYAPVGGMVHSFAFNNQYGDYGATVILLHQLEGLPFYTLYGHLSLRDIEHLSQGQYMIRGEKIGHFGLPEENGNWPPHLHFQIIFDMGLYSGDYPGVCRFSEKEKWLANSPDPGVILKMV
jgi:murein DD-endopeptidase MepM/ murein hydrolase activator NlpD